MDIVVIKLAAMPLILQRDWNSSIPNPFSVSALP
jgi:hypothetical protein